MTLIDYGVFFLLGLSIVWGAWQGLVREIAAMLAWVAAFFAASLFAGPMAELIPASVAGPGTRVVIAYLGLFAGALAVTTLLGRLLARLASAAGLGAFDRALGGLFGAVRGLLVALMFALLAGLTELPRDPLWRESVTAAPLAHSALALKPWLPPTFAERLRYD